jgi:long-chain acyl-CoA synthetase
MLDIDHVHTTVRLSSSSGPREPVMSTTDRHYSGNLASLGGLLRAAVVKRPEGLALVHGERRWTWRQVLSRVERAAGALVALGVGEDVRVAALALNSDRYVELHFAVPWAGGVFEPLNIRWSTSENAFALRAAGAAVLLVDDHFLDQGRKLLDACPALTTLVHIGDGLTPDGLSSYEELLAQAEPVPDAGRHGDDPYLVLYTSGTTAASKGVELSHANAVMTALAFHATIHLDSTSVHLHTLGLFHVGGAQPLWYVTMAAGTHVVQPSFDAASALELIARHGVTNTVMVPTMISLLLHQPGVDDADLTSMRICVYGGSPMPRSILDEAVRRLPTWQFHQIYGQTESSGYATALRWSDHLEALDAHPERLTSAGTTIPGAEVLVVDPQGEPLGAGETGEIVVRGGTVMRGYFDNDEESRRVLAGGWLRTGDAGFLDLDGFLYVADRVKDMIITGGENVYSVDVERALYEHPAVRECAVIGIPDPVWVEAVHAVVVLEPGAEVDGSELDRHCRRLVANYKVPRSYDFVEGPLPTTPVGKIRKNVLRDPFWTDQARRI